MTQPTLTARLRIPAAIALASYWICLFIATHIPQPERFIPPDLWDKGLHTIAYCGLTGLLLVNLVLRGPLRWSHVAAAVGLVAAVGLFDEITQIPFGRHFELLDLAADMIGALIATVLVALLAAALDRLPSRGLRQV